MLQSEPQKLISEPLTGSFQSRSYDEGHWTYTITTQHLDSIGYGFILPDTRGFAIKVNHFTAVEESRVPETLPGARRILKENEESRGVRIVGFEKRYLIHVIFRNRRFDFPSRLVNFNLIIRLEICKR